MDSMPMIFQTSTLSYEERFAVYWNSILGNCKPRDVKTRMGGYVEKSVRKTGWKAVWSCDNSPGAGFDDKDSFNLLVEIIDVDSQNLSAAVNISKPLVTDSQLGMQELQDLIVAREYHIPLTELLPIYDDSGDFDETALALEHVRFFYDNLWREWDEDDDGDYLYAARNLENRLRLYYDIAQENLSKDFIRKYTDTYNDYKQKVLDLRKLRKDMAASDSEQELETCDVLCLAQKTHELEHIVKSLQTMENPQMRYLLASASAVKKPRKTSRNHSVTMIVAQQLIAKMCKTLPDDTVIEHYTSLEEAIGCSTKNDSILIYSGIHHAVGPLNLEESITVTGVGETIIECDECAETSITIQSPELHLSNIRFMQTASTSRLLVVERGKVILSNCEFRCVSNGITVKRGAELVMRDCNVHGALSAGLTIEENSVVHVERCVIHKNGAGGNHGGIKIISSRTEPATVFVVESRIVENFGSGINIVEEHGTRNEEPGTLDGVRLQFERNITDSVHMS